MQVCYIKIMQLFKRKSKRKSKSISNLTLYFIVGIINLNNIPQIREMRAWLEDSAKIYTFVFTVLRDYAYGFMCPFS